MNESKLCSRCQTIKPIELFNRKGDSHNSYCRDCCKEYKKNYYIQNREAVKQESREYRKNNPDKVCASNKEYYATHRDEILAGKKEYAESNRETLKIKGQNYYRKNRARILAAQKSNEAKKQYQKEYSERYRNTPEGRTKLNSLSRKRKALKLRQLHPNHDFQIEKEMERERQRLERETGEKYAIDHIWPLSKGGLHHHKNLQIIPAAINGAKKDSLEFKHELAKHWTELPQWLIDECALDINRGLA